MPDPSPIIDVRGLTLDPGREPGIVDLSFSVLPREALGLLGPLQSGPSTTLRLLSTVIPPTAGSISIAGRDLADDDSIRRAIGYLPFHLGVYDDMAVAEYLDFFAHCAKVETSDWLARRPALLQLAGLSGQEETFVEKLSREDRQRLAVVRTLVHDPPVLLLDQPCAGLPLPARLRMRALLARILDSGKTLLIAANMLTDLHGLCHRIGVMAGGRLVALGPAAEIGARLTRGRLIEMELTHADPAALSLIAAHPLVGETDSDGLYVLFTLDGRADDPLAVARDLAARGVPIRRLREHEINPAALDPAPADPLRSSA